jgi:hypothetical protein
LKTDRARHDSTAREWTSKYAMWGKYAVFGTVVWAASFCRYWKWRIDMKR